MVNEIEIAHQQLAQEAQENRVKAIKLAVKHKDRLLKEIGKIDKLLNAADSGNFYDLVSVYISVAVADEQE